MPRLALAIVLLLVAAAAPAQAAFVGDVSLVDGLGTVSVDAGGLRTVPHQWITRDGGRTFQRLTVGGRSDVTATVLANGLAYAQAHDGRLWRSVDGGRTWKATAGWDDFQLTATSTSAWALRARGKRVWIVRSEDGGRSWHSRPLRVGGYEGPAVRIAFADAADGVITGLRPSTSGADGKPFLLITQDGGRTWTQRRQPCSHDAVGFKAPSDAQWLASGTLWLLCIGAGGAGAETLEVHTSVDAGRTFALRSRAPLPGSGAPGVGRFVGAGHINGFSAVTNRQAFMSFGYGLTVTQDGGRRWRELRHLPSPFDGSSILSIDGRARYLALGGYGLWKSPDAGAHWRRLKIASR
jgi:photosystem II stability/assembly factor-like uncharacterized protein